MVGMAESFRSRVPENRSQISRDLSQIRSKEALHWRSKAVPLREMTNLAPRGGRPHGAAAGTRTETTVKPTVRSSESSLPFGGTAQLPQKIGGRRPCDAARRRERWRATIHRRRVSAVHRRQAARRGTKNLQK